MLTLFYTIANKIALLNFAWNIFPIFGVSTIKCNFAKHTNIKVSHMMGVRLVINKHAYAAADALIA